MANSAEQLLSKATQLMEELTSMQTNDKAELTMQSVKQLTNVAADLGTIMLEFDTSEEGYNIRQSYSKFTKSLKSGKSADVVLVNFADFLEDLTNQVAKDIGLSKALDKLDDIMFELEVKVSDFIKYDSKHLFKKVKSKLHKAKVGLKEKFSKEGAEDTLSKFTGESVGMLKKLKDHLNPKELVTKPFKPCFTVPTEEDVYSDTLSTESDDPFYHETMDYLESYLNNPTY